MTRNEATTFAHECLLEHGLKDWHVRLTTDMTKGFLGLCSHADKAIILSAHHIDIHDTEMVKNTIRHEVAHALTPGHSHDAIWRAKARDIGCINTESCSNLSFTPEAIDAIRSGAR
jgi:SprT-like family.